MSLMEMEFLPEEKDNLVKNFECNIEKLCSVKDSIPDWWLDMVEKTVSIVNQLKSHPVDRNTDGTSKIEDSAVKLWNHVVPLKTQGCLSNISNAKLRNICLMALVYSGSNLNSDAIIKRQIIMGLKTARAWIECSNMDSAEHVLNITHQCAMKLKSSLIEKSNTSSSDSGNNLLERQRLDVDKDIFKILTYKAEVAVGQMKNEVALNMIFTAKEMLARFPKETAYLCMFCYNIGVDTFQHEHFEESVSWLKESYELGKGRPDIDPKNQARTLRLLANSYLEWDCKLYCDKSMNAVTLANTEYIHVAGLYLKLRILFISSESSTAVNTVLNDITKHPDATLELGVNVINLMRKHNRYDMEYPVKLLQKYENSLHFGKLATSHFEALLACKLLHAAKEFTEEIVTGHNTGRILEPNIKKQFQHIFWEQAAVEFEGGNHSEALQWYNYSLSLISSTERSERNMAKLQRNRASCLISLGKYSQADEILTEAVRCDETAAATYYLVYKLSLLQENPEIAISSLQKMICCIKNEDMSSDSSTDLGLICLAAQLALKLNSHTVASIAMEYFINNGNDDGQVLVAIRCLLRLQISLSENNNDDGKILEKIYEMILLAYNKLLVIQNKCEENVKFVVQDEAIWFMKIAWNLGLKCKEDAQKTKEFFTLCYELLSLCGSDANNASRQKTCVMISTFSCLQLAHISTDEKLTTDLYEEVLHHINSFRQYSQLTDTNWAGGDGGNGKDNCDILLLLCEFEARIKLGDPQADKLLEKAISSPQPDAKTFEIIAALSIEPPASNKNISVRALKIAIRTHLQTPQPDYERCSKDIHSLIQMSICNVTSDPSVKEETMNYYKETIDVIENKAKANYPEMEILWLMTKAWNCGIHFYRFSNYNEAERWCGVGLHLLSLLATMKGNYEEKMNTIYGEILANIEKIKPMTSLEE